MCGHSYHLCYKMAAWINDLGWCAACRIAPPNRGHVLNLIYDVSHSNSDPWTACHDYDARITGIGRNGMQLPKHLYDPITQTWPNAN